MIERGLQRPNVVTVGENRADVTQGHNRPSSSPVEKIGPALELVNVGEEAGHQRGSRQQCQCDEALVGQGLGQFPVPNTDGSVATNKNCEALCASRWPETSTVTHGDNRAAARGGTSMHNAKYL